MEHSLAVMTACIKELSDAAEDVAQYLIDILSREFSSDGEKEPEVVRLRAAIASAKKYFVEDS
jgi:hypothetical protein